jgi:hypothetical protein
VRAAEPPAHPHLPPIIEKILFLLKKDANRQSIRQKFVAKIRSNDFSRLLPGKGGALHA